MENQTTTYKSNMQEQFINILVREESASPLQFSNEQSVKMRSKQIGVGDIFIENQSRSFYEDNTTIKKSDTHCKRTINYIDILNANNNYSSRAIELKQTIGTKGGRPRKAHGSKSINKRKKLKRRELWNSIEDEIDSELEGEYNTFFGSAALPSTSVVEALDVIEKRKNSIKAKLLVRKENLLTQEEEQDIHTRADIYAITTYPDTQFYVLPDEDHVPRPSVRIEEVHIDSAYPPTRKKRRRNYGNTNCYVVYHNMDDSYDNTKQLPLGTRLIKPPTKLVELVAQAIDGSPDGLLQVQQIYTYLQNKYPFFRYMERMAINSWRSSIRHALYQKWFRKIRFDLSYISSKGCYWAINPKSNPKEWTLPDNSTGLDSEDYCLDTDLEIDPELNEKVYALLQEEQLNTNSENLSDVVSIARDYGISIRSNPNDVEETNAIIDVENLDKTDTDVHVPSPVREPDPILATCVPYWAPEDVCLSSTESGHGTMSPSVNSPPFLSLESPTFLSDDIPAEIRSDLLLGTPLNSPHNEHSGILQSKIPYVTNSKPQSQTMTDKVPRGSTFSPIANWTPNWEEYGSYIISPQNMATQKCVYGWSLGRFTDTDGNYTSYRHGGGDIGSPDAINGTGNISSSDSTFSDIEVIAEFTKSELSSPDHASFEEICG